MNINVEDYLSHDEIKSICQEALKQIVKNSLSDKNNLERIISNCCYDILFKHIDNAMDNNLQQIVTNKTIDIINNYNTDFGIFRVKNAWDKEESIGTTIVKQTVKDNAHILKDNVIKSLHNIPKSVINASMKDILKEKMDQIFK